MSVQNAVVQARRYDAAVLIVDDHDAVRSAVRDWLKASFPGLRAHEARDAEDALCAIETTRFDIVLMDIGLPGLSGVEATRLLRVRAPSTTVVMVSVHDNDTQRAAALAAGAVAFVSKRRMHEGLSACLGNLLARLTVPSVAATLVGDG